jgi:Secretion system C-terminal sorting domain
VLYCSIQGSINTAPESATLSFQGQVVQDHPDVFHVPAICNTPPVEETETANTVIITNPVQGTMQIQSTTTWQSITIFDAIGKQIQTIPYTTNLDVSALAQGMYFVVFTDTNKPSITKKVIKN